MTGRMAETMAEETGPRPSPGLFRLGLGLTGAGAVLSVLLLSAAGGASRFAFAYLFGYAFVWSIVLGCLLLVSLHHLTHAVWSVVVRRAAEMLAELIGLTALLFLPILAFLADFNRFHLFPWTSAAFMAESPGLSEKEIYLNVPFFIFRAALYFIIWIVFARVFIGESLRQDAREGAEAGLLRLRRLSGPFVILFAFTVSFAGFDWLMSLEPRWFSTIFGVYVFAGMALAAMAAVTLTSLWFEKTGRLGQTGLNAAHRYTLGVVIFSFACFWAYIAFSQYMLIWYANTPEESLFFTRRLGGGWLFVSVALGLIRFVIPFLALLSQRAKMNRTILTWVSILMLAGQALDLYWLIMPRQTVEGSPLSVLECGPFFLLTGLCLIRMARFLKLHPPAAYGDPLYSESKEYRI